MKCTNNLKTLFDSSDFNHNLSQTSTEKLNSSQSGKIFTFSGLVSLPSGGRANEQ